MQSTSTNSGKAKLMIKATLFCVVFTALFWACSFIKPMFPQQWERLTHGIIGTVAALVTTFVFLKSDGSSFAKIGLSFRKTTIRNFSVGLLTGILIMGTLTAIIIRISGFRTEINHNSSFANFIVLSLPLIVLAYMEELAFRAYPLELLKTKAGIRSSLLITSLLFALYHIANGWSIQNSLLGPGPWGIIFGLAAVYSNGISMPTGLHFGVNLTTSAFAINDSSFNLWVLKQHNGESLSNYQSSNLEVLLPQISILALAIILMEWYLRKKATGNIHLPK